jgi:hypothetical protein
LKWNKHIFVQASDQPIKPLRQKRLEAGISKNASLAEPITAMVLPTRAIESHPEWAKLSSNQKMDARKLFYGLYGKKVKVTKCEQVDKMTVIHHEGTRLIPRLYGFMFSKVKELRAMPSVLSGLKLPYYYPPAKGKKPYKVILPCDITVGMEIRFPASEETVYHFLSRQDCQCRWEAARVFAAMIDRKNLGQVVAVKQVDDGWFSFVGVDGAERRAMAEGSQPSAVAPNKPSPTVNVPVPPNPIDDNQSGSKTLDRLLEIDDEKPRIVVVGSKVFQITLLHSDAIVV